MIFRIIVCLFLLTGSAQAEESSPDISPNQEGRLQGVEQLHIVLSKLNETLRTNKDLDALEALGMPAREITRLKMAVDLKVRQLTEDAIYVIRSI